MLIRKMQTKTTWRYHYSSAKMAKIKNIVTGFWQELEQWEFSYFAGEYVNSFNPLKTVWIKTFLATLFITTPN